MTEMYCIVSGNVQNVRYRDYAQTSAGELEVVGWVRNLSNGTVELAAQGTPDQLKDFVEYLHEGSVLATVEAVDIGWRTAKKVYDDFSILYD